MHQTLKSMEDVGNRTREHEVQILSLRNRVQDFETKYSNLTHVLNATKASKDTVDDLDQLVTTLLGSDLRGSQIYD